jgi:lipooligosaccharide transport system ATP-binding protein
VVEVHGPGLEAWREQARSLVQRGELAGDTLFCYAAEVEPVIASLRAHPELVYMHRPANLEDLFLKLTGRDLRD